MCYRLLHKIILYSSKVRNPDRFSVCSKFYCGVTLNIEGKTTWQLRCYPIVILEFFLEKEVIHFFSRKKTIWSERLSEITTQSMFFGSGYKLVWFVFLVETRVIYMHHFTPNFFFMHHFTPNFFFKENLENLQHICIN